MSILKTSFGCLPTGQEADLYTITNASGASVSLTNYGGIITSIVVHDRDGKLGDVALGCATVSDYVPNNGYIGAAIGRYGNRIGHGRFTFNGKEMQLAANSNGHHLHGGEVGFDKKLMDAEVLGENAIKLSFTSPDGEENYPGTLKVSITYSFNDENELKLHYDAVSDKDTIINMTNHSYFNLAGHDTGDVLGHKIAINASSFTVVDKDCIPTGEVRSLDGHALDLRTPKIVGEGIKAQDTDEQMAFGLGYDHNYVLNKQAHDHHHDHGEDCGCNHNVMGIAAVVSEDTTGRVMGVYTDKPAIQFYTGNFLDGTMIGKGGKPYPFRSGFCLETQYYPDSVNHENFPSCVYEAGEEYSFTTVYKFSTK